MSLFTTCRFGDTDAGRLPSKDPVPDATLEYVVWPIQEQRMRIRIFRREIRLSFKQFDVLLYLFWPFKFRKVRYPNGEYKTASGAFSVFRSPSERRLAHDRYVHWEEEIRRRRIAEGADGMVIGSSPVPPTTVPGGE